MEVISPLFWLLLRTRVSELLTPDTRFVILAYLSRTVCIRVFITNVIYVGLRSLSNHWIGHVRMCNVRSGVKKMVFACWISIYKALRIEFGDLLPSLTLQVLILILSHSGDGPVPAHVPVPAHPQFS